ncbi:hypothetical protein J7E71_10720 [Mesobacillus foraminis]|uniref:hypothetical protein n=1 Tax=Mesobacillus foraminis TaxID=279826 RepID=UPI001BE8C4E2|nr:hypothetical protein [Mesobacillus foraminis]MBT2756427.1 hypothetical protein [Mesobacillus foraminis]
MTYFGEKCVEGHTRGASVIFFVRKAGMRYGNDQQTLAEKWLRIFEPHAEEKQSGEGM